MKSIEEIYNLLKEKYPEYDIQLNTEFATDNFLLLNRKTCLACLNFS
jgi:hypothetical protein